MNKFLLLVASLLLHVSIMEAQQSVELTILHYNDFHAQNVPVSVRVSKADGSTGTVEVGGAATLAALIQRYRDSLDNVILLHAGDDVQGTPISSLTNGRSQFELLELLQPDVMTLGNHEFDHGAENLRQLIASVTFPIVSANLWDKSIGAPFVPRYRILRLRGLSVAVIGLAPPDLPSLVMREHVRDIDVLEAATVVRHTMHELERNFNIQFFIILSHMGFERDSALAAAVDGIDVIVGGHSHTVLQRPKQVNDALIVQAGSRGQWLGVLRLHVDPVTGVIQSHDGQLLATRVDEVEAHPVVASKVAELEAMVAEGLGEVIATLESDWKREPRGESNIGNWQADVMRDFAGTDIAFQNSGGIRKDLDAGPITLRDMWEISPFGNEFVIFEVSGARLLEMLRYHATQSREFCQVSGLRYSYDATLPPEKALHVEINGQPVNGQRSYSIVTNSYIGGHLHDVFGLPEKDITLRKSMPVMVDRDVFIDHARRQGRILSRVEGRIHIIGERP